DEMKGIRAFATAALLCAAAAWAAEAPASLAEALAGAGRAAEDQARDAGRKPTEVIAFLGIEPGITVMDVIAAGGYYTEVLSLAVGPEGKVYAQNPEWLLKFREGAADKAMTARLEGGRLANVERVDRSLTEVDLEPGSLDAAITALNFHDVYNGRGVEAAAEFLGGVHRLLKPGGVLGLIDHAGNAEENNEQLHRIEESRVDVAVKAAGFEIEAKSDLLRNADDDRKKTVFDPEIRGKTDRFVMRLRKPE
ncbi:MAG: methyltransferase, partial [Gemmatimonadota bacterium]